MKILKSIGSHVFVRKIKDETPSSGIIVTGVHTPRYEVVAAPEWADVSIGDVVYVDEYAEPIDVPDAAEDLLCYRHSHILAKEKRSVAKRRRK